MKLDKQFFTGRNNKKLDWKNAKYIVKKIINLYSVKFDIFKGVYDVFYVNKLYLTEIDLFFS